MKQRPLHSAHGNIHWVIIVGLFIIAVILGVSMMWQKQELTEIKQSLSAKQVTPTTTAPTTQEKTADTKTFQVINRQSFRYTSAAFPSSETAIYSVEQRCDGQAKYASLDGGLSDKRFCIGRNQLVLIDPSGKEKILSDQMVKSAEFGAPLLRGLAWFSGDHIAIEYGSDACATAGDCGVGDPERFVTMVLDEATMKVIPTGSFPQYGQMIWNKPGTKAVVIPKTCGGAGCDERALGGYKLLTDKTSTLTKEKASDGGDSAEDVSGTKLAHWGWIHWTDDSTVEAEIVQPNGTRKALTINF